MSKDAWTGSDEPLESQYHQGYLAGARAAEAGDDILVVAQVRSGAFLEGWHQGYVNQSKARGYRDFEALRQKQEGQRG